MTERPFFEECRVWWWGGYYIPVRNSVNFQLEKRHITNKEKELYEQEFGEKIVYDEDFVKWRDKIGDRKKVKTEDTSQ